jgi:hypothetical protein
VFLFLLLLLLCSFLFLSVVENSIDDFDSGGILGFFFSCDFESSFFMFSTIKFKGYEVINSKLKLDVGVVVTFLLFIFLYVCGAFL